MPERSFDRYILVTGGAGFIGSHFLEYFVNKYPLFHFTCIDKLNYVSYYSTKYLDVLESLPNFKFIRCDMATDPEFLTQFLVSDFQTNKVTDIINFAAESSVDISFQEPVSVITNNIVATTNLLESFRLLALANPLEKLRFVHISTDEVYGDELDPSDEGGRLQPTNPYAASKASLDLIINAYKRSWRLPISVVRPNNVYGPRQYPNKLVASTIDNLRNKRPIKIHGNGRNARCYLHVLDLVRALELIWLQASATDVFNVGSSGEIENLALVEIICKLYLKQERVDISSLVEFVKDREYNDRTYQINCDKLKKLGWEPKVPLARGLAEMIRNDAC